MNNYLKYKKSEDCYGCRACEQICPFNAIYMTTNEEGFLYPEIDYSKCKNCNLCKKVCPHDSMFLEKKQPLKCYAGKYNNEYSLEKSSSGGIFSALADYFLENNGYVVGCIFDNNFSAIHVVTNEKHVVEKMRGSKYVQSDTKNTYLEVKHLLETKKYVLFVGTPCQVDGLKNFLSHDYETLLTVDLFCHGVPSPKLFSYFLNAFKNKKGNITSISFRDKERYGWCSKGSIKYQNKTKSISPYNNTYYNLYYIKNNINRKCCYECKYASTSRIGDISIGDFWGIDMAIPNFDYKKGVSAILLNSEKGINYFKIIQNRMTIMETNLDSITKYNKNLISPSKMPDSRNYIYKNIYEQGYEKTVKKECNLKYISPFIRKITPKFLKKSIKKLIKKKEQ